MTEEEKKWVAEMVLDAYYEGFDDRDNRALGVLASEHTYWERSNAAKRMAQLEDG